MDYKKLIHSRSARLRLLQLMRFVPDSLMLRLQYRIKMGRKLNLKKPERYTEKIQWYKLYYRDPMMIPCVDKYDVRDYIRSLGLGELLVECYGVYDRPEDIPFETLPNQFVLKDTLAGGGTAVIIVKDKASLPMEQTLQELRNWVNRPYNTPEGGREWPYYSGKRHRILVEAYLDGGESSGLTDYKFLCFQGRAEYLQYLTNRTLGDAHLTEVIFDRDFHLLPVCGLGHDNVEPDAVEKPLQYDKMVRIAEKISRDFPHARIDLYNIKGKIYFGEITFFAASGYKRFTDDQFDYEMGEKFVLPEKRI